MATYSKVTDANGTTRYKDGAKFVKADDVPENVKTALGEQPDGTQLDELGDPIDPSTESDESEDEDAPTTNDTPADDDTTADETSPAPAPEAVETVPQTDEGMGFKRSKGKTLSVFSNKPHETVKNVAGVMVPMTVEEYNTKTDAEIVEKLKSLGKL